MKKIFLNFIIIASSSPKRTDYQEKLPNFLEEYLRERKKPNKQRDIETDKIELHIEKGEKCYIFKFSAIQN